MRRPMTLTIAVVLQWIAALLALLLGLQLVTAAFELSGADTESAVEKVLVAQGITDVPQARVVLAVFMAGIIIMAIAFLRVVLALYLARGRGWARVIITVLVGLNILGGVAYLFQAAFWQGAAIIGLELIVLWLLYNPASSAFIAERSGSENPA